MKKLRIALDWTANTNHTGFYVAQEKGFYKEVGLDVEIGTPALDNYAITPAKKVELGEADFALCPLESVVSYRAKKKPFDAVALATIFKEDISAIASLAKGPVQRPKDMDGKRYASYKARYEDEIVRQMIKNDGGEGELKIAYPEKLGIWETILDNSSHATWIFMNWEGIRAEDEGIQLNFFKMSDYGIPYGYSPIIMTSNTMANNNKKAYSDFLKATKKGFLFTQENPEDAILCIRPFVAEQDRNIDLVKSQKFTNSFYGNAMNWGILEKSNVNLFLKWLYDNGLEEQRLFHEDISFKV